MVVLNAELDVDVNVLDAVVARIQVRLVKPGPERVAAFRCLA